MWLNWLPWKYIVRYVARKKGFIDPIALLARINAVAQPAQTMAPVELLRAGAVLHARGFMNNNVIQHNLDWVWPYWVERQFDPGDPAFIPRAFSMTHINLTQRNWTAVGYPGCAETPVVDARGLVMPFFDSWSLEGWFVPVAGEALLPSRAKAAKQWLEYEPNLKVITETAWEGSRLTSTSEVIGTSTGPRLRVTLHLKAGRPGALVACLRPYNAEGVSFVNDLAVTPDAQGWDVNGKPAVRFSRRPDTNLLSTYHEGDVYAALHAGGQGSAVSRERVACEVGMATGAAVYHAYAGDEIEVQMEVALGKDSMDSTRDDSANLPPNIPPTIPREDDLAEKAWSEALAESIPFSVGGTKKRFGFFYHAATRTTVLLSPREIFAGPYTYKRFWYRDAAIIVHAIMCAGHKRIAKRALDFFLQGQTRTGYFKSQEGEWDSNGQVLWAFGRYGRLFNESPDASWVEAARKAVLWIERKRAAAPAGERQDGLMPAGFSAEHLGPNDHYYWDDFWTIGGLRLAAEMLRAAGDSRTAETAAREAEALAKAVEVSLALTAARYGASGMPASPHRRPDSGAVGSLAVAFPLQLWPAGDPRIAATTDYLCRNCLIYDAFYHDISHSGINPYLSLHIAQSLLRDGDVRFAPLMEAIAALASDTGQWPEAIHPQLRTGCMGDGQHAWAAAEWLMMIRNCFVFEEEYENRVVIAAGITPDWCDPETPARFGPAPTRFGSVTVSLERRGEDLKLNWAADWFGAAPEIEIRFAPEGWDCIEMDSRQRVYRRRTAP